jgi:hypothetical protein
MKEFFGIAVFNNGGFASGQSRDLCLVEGIWIWILIKDSETRLLVKLEVYTIYHFSIANVPGRGLVPLVRNRLLDFVAG